MHIRFLTPTVAAIAGLVYLLTGCAAHPNSSPVASSSDPAQGPILAPATPSAIAPTTAPSTQPVDVVAELAATKITRTDLDNLLYKTYGLQMVFDLIELDLAKNTLLVQQNKTLQQGDIDRERSIVFAQMFKEQTQPDYEAYFTQFLQKEKIKREEFDVRAIQTSACLRKIVEPIVIGKFSDAALRRGYEIMYGANRQIADITLGNVRDADIARQRLKTEPFDKVAREMSIDKDTRDSGGLWPPFSAQSREVSQVIIDAAFSVDVGNISDILDDGSSRHIIKVLGVTEPKAEPYAAVKDIVKQQMEDKLVEKNMKALRQQLQVMAQQQIKFDDPVLKTQWDAVLAKQQPQSADKSAVMQQINEQKALAK